MIEDRRARQSSPQQTDPNRFRLFLHVNRPQKRISPKFLGNDFMSLSTVFKQQRSHQWASDGSDAERLAALGLFLPVRGRLKLFPHQDRPCDPRQEV